jgi:cation transport ATPase
MTLPTAEGLESGLPAGISQGTPWRLDQRLLRRSPIVIALAGLLLGLGLAAIGMSAAAHWAWTAATLPVVIALAVSMIRELMAGRLGVDAVALLSMSAALALGESLAAIVVAVMYAGGNVLEDYAVARAENDLKSLVDRAPRVAHRRATDAIGDVAIELVAVGDRLIVRGGEIVPVDGTVAGKAATIDESALTGEPIPVG